MLLLSRALHDQIKDHNLIDPDRSTDYLDLICLFFILEAITSISIWSRKSHLHKSSSPGPNQRFRIRDFNLYVTCRARYTKFLCCILKWSPLIYESCKSYFKSILATFSIFIQIINHVYATNEPEIRVELKIKDKRLLSRNPQSAHDFYLTTLCIAQSPKGSNKVKSINSILGSWWYRGSSASF